MNNMTMMNNATVMPLSMLSRGGVTDDWSIICASIAYDVALICGVIQLIATIILIVMKIKGKDRIEDKECKAGEEVA